MTQSQAERRRLETSDRSNLEAYQVDRFNELLRAVLPANRFYAEKLALVERPIRSLTELRNWPYTYKEELIGTHATRDLAANLTWPVERYSRFHQTSGTHGRPMIVLDAAEDWPWWMACWQYILDAAGIEAGDRAFFAFSFGPFIGFWTAFDAAAARGCLVIPGGGLSTRARLDLMQRAQATVLFCTPSYAMHLVEVAKEHKIDCRAVGIRALILAGEPGASVPAVRQQIEQAWQAQVFDHAGASEVGPWGYGYATGEGIHVNEAEFIAEFISVETGEPATDGELAELVLTTLGRIGSPVIRYRTGDLVRPRWHGSSENRFVFLEGGVLGRSDDMLVVRGVNIFPSSLEQILRSFPEIVEYRITVKSAGAMDNVLIEIEDRLNEPARVADELSVRLGLRVDLATVPLGTLPRFEGKARRFIDQRVRKSQL